MAAPGMGPQKIMQLSAGRAQAMLLRGFTAVRDVGGPSFELKRLIDSGRAKGPRIWPSGPMISQTSGHADLRGPDEPSRRFSDKMSKAEEVWASVIADGRDEVLTAVRENLRMGASQIKIAAGGGTSSEYDPLDVTQ
jgi:imidazolonepropionase-like amidohydrolase